MPHQRFAASVGAVNQEIFLFKGTVRDNLTLDSTIDDTAITRALRDADMLDFVAGEHGRNCESCSGSREEL